MRLNRSFLVMSFTLILGFNYSCKKENVSASTGNIEWVKVLSDTILSSTDSDFNLGSNGKVITDNDYNIYCYYNSIRDHSCTLLKLDSAGNILMTKVMAPFCAYDMLLQTNGTVVLSGIDQTHTATNWNLIYSVATDGTVHSVIAAPNQPYKQFVQNNTMHLMDDNSIVLSGSVEAQYPLTSPQSFLNFFIKLNPDLSIAWATHFGPETGSPELLSQNSILPLSNGNFLFEYEQSMWAEIFDSCYYGLLVGVLDPNGNLISKKNNNTGNRVGSKLKGDGAYYRYCNGLIDEGNGNAIYYYSSPTYLNPQHTSNSNAFIRINQDGQITDTMSFSLPPAQRIFSVTKNNDQFLMTVYRQGIVDGNSDYSALHTLIYMGDATTWQPGSDFSFQSFYSDLFFSSAAMVKKEYVLMGKIQTFNGPSNQLALVKYKSN